MKGLSRKLLPLMIFLVAAMTLSACSNYAAPITTTAPPATIKITSPTGNIVPQIGNVAITVEVANFNLVDKVGQTNAAGEGHILYFLDVEAPTMAGMPAVTASGTYAATTDTSYTWHNVGGGAHNFSVELVNNDNTPLNPPVTANISVIILPEIGPPTAVITSPREGAIIQGSDVAVSIQVSNFNLVAKIGESNVSHEGHVHYYLDVDAPTTAGQPAEPDHGIFEHSVNTTFTFINVAPGTHFVAIELVNNDSTPLDPPVVAKVTFTVQAAATTTPPTTTAPATTTPTPTQQSVTINLIAQGMAFDQSTITVPAGALVTLIFNNKDSGIPHNFSLYTDSSATKAIFIGQIISGPKTITYTFTAPATRGTYFFRCDVHPASMIGSFVVQ
ncbi:MAG: cupredoxin domain-containing protein [Dehalococcoidales bacterium]